MIARPDRRAAVQAVKKSVLMVWRGRRVRGGCVHTGTIPSKTLRETVLNLSGRRDRGFYGHADRRQIPEDPIPVQESRKTDTRASRTVRGAIRSRGRIAECPRLQQNDSRTTRRSTARSPDRQRIRLPPTVRAGAQGFFACAALPSGRCQHQGAVSPAPADVTLCCTTCNARNEVSSRVCQLPIDENRRDD